MTGTRDYDERQVERREGTIAKPERPRSGWDGGDGRTTSVGQGAPPDPRAVIDELRHRLRAEQEKSLNARDAVLGARAAAAQAKAETQELFYRLHVRETELAQLKKLLDEAADEEPEQRQPGADQAMEVDLPTPSRALRALAGSLKQAAQRW